MHFTVGPLRVEVTTRAYDIPPDGSDRLGPVLAGLADAVRPFPDATLGVHIAYHPANGRYEVELKLILPDRTLFVDDADGDLDALLARSAAAMVAKLRKDEG
jgi:hypothetical protein